MGEGDRPLLEVVLLRGEETERLLLEDLDFSVGSGEDTEGLLLRLGGVLERVSGDEEADRLLRETLAFLVSSGDERELRRRGGVRDFVFGSTEDLEPLRAVLDLGDALEKTQNYCFLQGKGLSLCLMNLIYYAWAGPEEQVSCVQEKNQYRFEPSVALLTFLSFQEMSQTY